MKAYLIDTPNKQIVEVDYDGNYKSIYGLIHASLYEVVYLNAEEDCMFLDEEGLINGNPHGWIKYEGANQPFRGYALVLGTDSEGNSVEPKMSIEELRAKVSFPEDDELQDPEEYAHAEVTGFDSPEALLRAMFGGRIP